MSDKTGTMNTQSDDTTATLSAKATAMLAGLHQTRVKALRDAATYVCSYCAGHSFPDDKGARDVHLLENGTGNYIHRVASCGDSQVLCKASGIWSKLAHESRMSGGGGA